MENRSVPPHVERMMAEAEELSDRITKLGLFLSGPIFASLHDTDQGLLQAQLASMTSYLSVLSIRITRSVPSSEQPASASA